MPSHLLTFSFVFSLMLLSACGSKPVAPPVIEAPIQIPNDVVQPVTIDGVQDGTRIDPESVAGRAPQERVIFFDYNQSEIRPEFIETVAEHGRYLAQTPEGSIRLEGHTDERGTREYNIALGENRAETIARMLRLQGVDASQVRTVSYGEELPAEEGNNNEAWAKNRRVNIIYETVVNN